jgi:hypothetical protein
LRMIVVAAGQDRNRVHPNTNLPVHKHAQDGRTDGQTD